MFGMVLAIGLLVDDAIVVVENVERVMARKACRREAAQSPGARSRARWSVRHGALGGIPTDGVLRRPHRGDLPAASPSPSCRPWPSR